MDRLVKLKRLCYLLFCRAVPYFIGPLVIEVPKDYYHLRNYLGTFALFILAFLSWKFVRVIFVRINSNAAGWLYPPFILNAILQMVLLQVFQNKIGPNMFYWVLAALAAQALQTAYTIRGSISLTAVTSLISSFAASYISIQILSQSGGLAALLFAFSIALMATAHYISELYLKEQIELTGVHSFSEQGNLSRFRYALQNLSKTYWTTFYSLCLSLPALIIAGLAVFNMLPAGFIFCLAVMPLTASLSAKCAKSTGKNLNKEAFFAESSGIYLLFIVIITFLGW